MLLAGVSICLVLGGKHGLGGLQFRKDGIIEETSYSLLAVEICSLLLEFIS